MAQGEGLPLGPINQRPRVSNAAEESKHYQTGEPGGAGRLKDTHAGGAAAGDGEEAGRLKQPREERWKKRGPART